MTSSEEANEVEKACGDINECDANPCDEVTQICQNSAGSFKCECRLGFENIAQGTGPACQDINGKNKRPISLIMISSEISMNFQNAKWRITAP